MVTTRSEAQRGLWGNRARKGKEVGGTSSQPLTKVALLNEKIVRMEKEMRDLAKANVALHQRNLEEIYWHVVHGYF